MSIAAARKFVEKALKDKKLARKLEAITDPKACVALAKECGCACTLAELNKAWNEILSSQHLDQVAGGQGDSSEVDRDEMPLSDDDDCRCVCPCKCPCVRPVTRVTAKNTVRLSAKLGVSIASKKH